VAFTLIAQLRRFKRARARCCNDGESIAINFCGCVRSRGRFRNQFHRPVASERNLPMPMYPCGFKRRHLLKRRCCSCVARTGSHDDF